MAKYLEAKCKLCRRSGEKLFLKGERCSTPKCAIVKRNYPPGFHGPKGKGRLSDYGQQLNEKQKVKRQYNLMEKQFKLTFDRASKKTGNVGENFIKMLEMRLDNVIFRLGIAVSRSQARQMISHGLFTLSDKKVTIPSYQTKTGDIIKIKSSKKTSKLFSDMSEKLKDKEVPGWLNLETKGDISAKVLHQPDIKSLKTNFNINVIVEYYSR